MGIPLDATEEKAATPATDAGESNWEDLGGEAPDDAEPKAEMELAEEPEATAPEPSQPDGPTPADAVVKARERIQKLREREERAKKILNETRRAIDTACTELGRAIVDSPDFFPTSEASEAPETPAVTIPENWRDAPLKTLLLWDSTTRILQKQHGMISVGDVATYLEANDGTMIGLDGMTERRDQQIRQLLAPFLASKT